MLPTHKCSECGTELGLMPAPYLCHRTRRVAQPHEPTSRRTPPPPRDPFDLRRGERAKPRRRRKPAAANDWLGDDLA